METNRPWVQQWADEQGRVRWWPRHGGWGLYYWNPNGQAWTCQWRPVGHYQTGPSNELLCRWRWWALFRARGGKSSDESTFRPENLTESGEAHDI